jgi:Uma2 family endonuclease
MNEQLRPSSLPLTTKAAEGLVRRRFAVAEIESMVAKGIIAEDERIELIGGEVVPMSPKGNRHEVIRTELAFHMSRQAPATLRVAAEAQFNLADDSYVVPDLLVYPATTRVHDVRGQSALLVIEIADSSLGYDLDTKAGITRRAACASIAVNARTLETRVHRQPSAAEYGNIDNVPAEAWLTPQSAPGSQFRSALDLD